MQLAPDLWRLELPNPGGTHHSINSYLFRGSDGYALFDCGQEGPDCWAVLTAKLDRLGVPLQALRTIVVSHGHRDHAGAAARLAERSGAPILLHQREPDYMGCRTVDNEDYHQLMADWLRRYGFPESEVETVIESARAAGGWTPSPAPDRLLAGGETLALGRYQFEVRWTPGHTPGHISLYEPRRRWLLCGDHILPSIRSNVSLQPFSLDNPLQRYAESLRDIASLEIDLALPGHGEPMTELAPRVAELLAHQQQRRGDLLALLTPTPQSAYQLASQVWSDRRRRSWADFHGRLRRNAVGTLAAHLEQLAADGLAERHADGVVRFSRRG